MSGCVVLRRRARKGGPALYGFVRSHLDVMGRLEPEGRRLPDEDAPYSGGVGWAPGALEGGLGHVGSDARDDERAARVANLVRWTCQRPSDRRRRVLYAHVHEDHVLVIADSLAEDLTEQPCDPQAVRELARWLAMTAPERGAVQVGLVLLGVAGVGDALDVVRVLAAHEEFTLYAAIAVANGTDHPEPELWAMAQKVDGWGRIHCVQRLQDATDPAIRAWILRTGFRNAVQDEYLALIAARTGSLVDALRGPHLDREVLTAAGDILLALMPGGPPVGDIDDYEGAAEAIELYLEAMRTRAMDLADLRSVTALQAWLSSDSWSERHQVPGWSAPQRELCLDRCREITGSDHWHDLIFVALLSEDQGEFEQAQRLAVSRGYDTFDILLARIERDPLDGPWWKAWREADRSRAGRLCEAARALLPLDLIASGPVDERPSGLDLRQEAALGCTLQSLRDHPGIGGDLLQAGLRSPVAYIRLMATVALWNWPRSAWPPGTHALLQAPPTQDPREQSDRYAD